MSWLETLGLRSKAVASRPSEIRKAFPILSISVFVLFGYRMWLSGSLDLTPIKEALSSEAPLNLSP